MTLSISPIIELTNACARVIIFTPVQYLDNARSANGSGGGLSKRCIYISTRGRQKCGSTAARQACGDDFERSDNCVCVREEPGEKFYYTVARVNVFAFVMGNIKYDEREREFNSRTRGCIMNAISPLVTRELGIDIRNVSFFSSSYLQVLFTWKNRGDERG